MKRLSHATLTVLATLLFAVPTESEAFFGFFGFNFGFGGGWGGNWWGPGYGYGYHPWYYGSYRPYWLRPYGYYGYGYYPYYAGYPVHAYPYTVTLPSVTAPETAKSK